MQYLDRSSVVGNNGETPGNYSIFTCVDPNPELQLMMWQVAYTKEEHVTQQFQCHACDLSCVFDAIELRTTADHNVCITDRLDLEYNRPFSYSRYWTGTSLKWRLMRANIIKKSFISFAFEKIARISLHCKLVPVQYREYETGLLCSN